MAAKLDTRQKMINMMYLVFIAMLALNIGKEVLATLGVLNDDLESSIVELEASSQASYQQIESNSGSADYEIAASNVLEIKKEADSFYDFLQTIKDSLIVGDEGEVNKYLKEINVKGTDSVITVTSYQEMDKSLVLDDILFESSDGDLKPIGETFLNKFKNFPHLGLIFSKIYLRDIRIKIFKKPVISSFNKKSYWLKNIFNVFLIDLSNSINNLPYYKNESKIAAVRNHSNYSKIFNFISLLILKSENYYNLKTFLRYKKNLKQFTNYNLISYLIV
ncbi:MAG: hypothetical protein HON33_00515, partial [Flavobacteriaceae bacterium]|nr:hypothetical protein [Flavobacteriaceae bacterium]